MATVTSSEPKPAPSAVETFTVKVDSKPVVAPKFTPDHAGKPTLTAKMRLAASPRL